ncbi:MAG TPA: hypothetical protein VLU41_05260 [Ideonella sp.]|nr:hypothetical protein [Ideonella sp.]
MKRIVLCLALLSAALGAPAQTDAEAPAPTDETVGAAPLQSNGVKYLNGGASEEDRNRMLAQSVDYPVRIALSGAGGQYLVADALTLTNAAGREIASVPNAGPFVMFNLPPGRYVAQVALPDGERGQRALTVGREALTIDWAFPGAPR